jgi:hypothetical protein
MPMRHIVVVDGKIKLYSFQSYMKRLGRLPVGWLDFEKCFPLTWKEGEGC